MRIIAGEFGSRRIEAPPGNTSRPTADRVREALFSMLGTMIEDAAVLDLFAGSGALSLEALSRGAARALLCDTDADACAVIQKNIEKLGVTDRAQLVKREALALARELCAKGSRFDLIFLDPPYHAGIMPEALALCAQLLNPGGRIVTETDASFEPEAVGGIVKRTSRKYGDTRVCIFVDEHREA